MMIHNTRIIISEGAQIEAYVQLRCRVAKGFSNTRI